MWRYFTIIANPSWICRVKAASSSSFRSSHG
jgi:hypothetical protein